jgi:hypothetical protein
MIVHNASFLQVVREHKKQSRESYKHGGAQTYQSPVVPGDTNGTSTELTQNVRPQISSKLSVDWGKRFLQGFANLSVVGFSHVLVLMSFHSDPIPA